MLASDAITEIALVFVGDADFDSQLRQALAILGRHLDVSRCRLFVDAADGATSCNRHQWCAPGVEPLDDRRQDTPYPALPLWQELLGPAEVYAIEDVGSLPAALRSLLEAQGIRALALAPLHIGGQFHGCLDFADCRQTRHWSKREIETLETIAGMLSAAYAKKLLAERLSSSERNFRSFFNSVDDIITVADLKGRIVFVNGSAGRKLGYPLAELCGKHLLELHPFDKRSEACQILTAMFHQGLACSPIELETRDGLRIPVETRLWLGEWNGQECIFGLSKDLSAERSALQKFERLFRSNPAPMAMSSMEEQRFIDINDAFLDKLGYRREEVIGRSALELGIFADAERWRAVQLELVHSGSVRNRELDFHGKDQRLFQGLFSGDIINSLGQVFCLTVMIDITEQIRLRTALNTARQRLSNIIEGTRLGTWEWNVQTGELVCNERWAEILGYTLAELGPLHFETWARLAHPDDLAESQRRLERHFDGGSGYYDCECRMRHKDGSWIWVHDRGKVVERDAEGRPLRMYGTHTDITEKKAMEQQIRELAFRDPLTEAYNRRYIFERLEEIASEYTRSGRSFCISVLDIDRFKAVNDTYGHQAGDFVLKTFTQTIAAAIRPHDLLGRYGGEEFIIVSIGAEAQGTAMMVERLMGAIRSKGFTFEGREIRFTFSCGIADCAEFPRAAFSIEKMIALADRRLYAAKDAGRDRCVGP